MDIDHSHTSPDVEVETKDAAIGQSVKDSETAAEKDRCTKKDE